MAGINLSAATPEFTTGTSKKTVLQILAPTNRRLVVKEWGVSFKGTSNTEAPILVELIRQSTAGLDGDVLTPRKMNSADDETVQTTALSNIDGSTQPTDGDVLARKEVHPQGGYDWQAPFGGEIHVPGGERLGIAVSAGSAVNMTAHFVFEE